MVHDIVIELDFVPIREDGLERGTSTLGSFRPRNRDYLVWIHQSIGVLFLRQIERSAGLQSSRMIRVNVARKGYAMYSKQAPSRCRARHQSSQNFAALPYACGASSYGFSLASAASTSGSICSEITKRGARAMAWKMYASSSAGRKIARPVHHICAPCARQIFQAESIFRQ